MVVADEFGVQQRLWVFLLTLPQLLVDGWVGGAGGEVDMLGSACLSPGPLESQGSPGKQLGGPSLQFPLYLLMFVPQADLLELDVVMVQVQQWLHGEAEACLVHSMCF